MNRNRSSSGADQALRQAALDYHALPTAGKLAIAPTKPLGNAADLALAYSPGVAAPCLDTYARKLARLPGGGANAIA